MKGWMYILECSDGSYYTGSTVNLEKRLWEHNNSLGANYTKKKHPVKLVYCEEYNRIDEAFLREKQVQGWSRAKKKALIAGEWNKLPGLAKKDFSKCRGHLDTPPAAVLGDHNETQPMVIVGDRSDTLQNGPVGECAESKVSVAECFELNRPVAECSERSEERIETSGSTQRKEKE